MNKTCKSRINNIASQCINQNNKTKKKHCFIKINPTRKLLLH